MIGLVLAERSQAEGPMIHKRNVCYCPSVHIEYPHIGPNLQFESFPKLHVNIAQWNKNEQVQSMSDNFLQIKDTWHNYDDQDEWWYS